MIKINKHIYIFLSCLFIICISTQITYGNNLYERVNTQDRTIPFEKQPTISLPRLSLFNSYNTGNQYRNLFINEDETSGQKIIIYTPDRNKKNKQILKQQNILMEYNNENIISNNQENNISLTSIPVLFFNTRSSNPVIITYNDEGYSPLYTDPDDPNTQNGGMITGDMPLGNAIYILLLFSMVYILLIIYKEKKGEKQNKI